MERESITEIAKRYDEGLKAFFDGLRKAAEALIKAFEPLVDAARRFVAQWVYLRDERARRLGRSSAQRYALAGYPYGKNTRGKKRFLLKMSERRRRVIT